MTIIYKPGNLSITMQTIAYNLVEKFLSLERLGSYMRMADGDNKKAIDLYRENLSQCQIFYTKLHWLEVGLRNTLNRQLIAKYGDNWFDCAGLTWEYIEQQQIMKAKELLQKDGKPASNGNVVATLNFGFWVNLFNNPYENLWRYCLRKSFPYCMTALSRKEFRKKVHPMLKLRNRIAHYEPILGYNLAAAHKDIAEIIQWIEPGLVEVL